MKGSKDFIMVPRDRLITPFLMFIFPCPASGPPPPPFPDYSVNTDEADERCALNPAGRGGVRRRGSNSPARRVDAIKCSMPVL